MNIETIYQDFITKALPTIQSGLTITKDYFLDLFDRYIKYLVITDVISLVIELIIFFFVINFLIEEFKEDKDAFANKKIVAYALLIFFSLVISFNIDLLIKDIFIPEIRVIEAFKELNTSQVNECSNK